MRKSKLKWCQTFDLIVKIRWILFWVSVTHISHPSCVNPSEAPGPGGRTDRWWMWRPWSWSGNKEVISHPWNCLKLKDTDHFALENVNRFVQFFSRNNLAPRSLHKWGSLILDPSPQHAQQTLNKIEVTYFQWDLPRVQNTLCLKS